MFLSIEFSERTAAVFDAALGRLAAIGRTERAIPKARCLAIAASRAAGPAADRDRIRLAAAARRAGAPCRCRPKSIARKRWSRLPRRNDIDVVFENRSVASSSTEDLPAVMLTKDGMGRMLVGRNGRHFIGLHAGKSYFIDQDALTREEAGTIFLVRPRGLAPGGNLAELVSAVAVLEPADPVRGSWVS